MKIISIVLLTLFISTTLKAQEITGQWNGILKVQGIQLRVVFNVIKTSTGYRSTMDSPDQGAKDIPVTNTTFEGSKIKFEVSNAKIEYRGELKGNDIVGTFKQGGQESPMILSRSTKEKSVLKRPQEPSKPYPYYSEEVTFQNLSANISLAGTLTLPKKEGMFPVVVLISASGPQNRDEELMGHKPFLVISDYLTRNGIAVLRYDDRGVGQSKGNFANATSADFATDVGSAIAYLKTRKEINKRKIGLIGHSEGGMIAPMVAAKSKDVAFIILTAAPGLPGDQLMLLQKEKIELAMQIDEKEVAKSQKIFSGAYRIILNSQTDDDILRNKLNTYFKQSFENKISDEQVNAITASITSPWMQYLLKYNPATILEKVTCPVLAINGEKDLQVLPTENLAAIKKALSKAGNKHVTTLELANLNHLFQETKTGLPAEYSIIEQTFAPAALVEITKWIKMQTE